METIVLTGKDLTISELVAVARENAKVEISAEAKERLVSARQLVFDLVDADYPIYGFNVGVGWNKDKKVFKEFFQKYNCNLIRSHCIGVPPYANEEETRAVMLARLNTMLTGCTGLSLEIPQMYADMLNAGIHPLIPERGSVGEGDIGLLSHIGLAIIGEGDVIYRGKRMPSAEAFEIADLKPVALGPKDGLAIVSSNALGAGQAAIALHELEEFLDIAEVIYAASLEGLEGNVSPLDDRNHALRRYKGQRAVAKRLRGLLEGSYLHDPNPERPLQDPLCYRDVPQLHGAVWEMLAYAKERLEIQLNTTDDNPCLLLEERHISPSANFDPINWVLAVEALSAGLSHISKASCLRMIKLGNPAFTRLSRFLSPADDVICFGTIQKTPVALDAEIRQLCTPCSMDCMPLAGDMEDISTNSPLVAQNLRKIIDNLRYIFAIELMHAAQAVDLRKTKKLGKGTKPLFAEVRKRVSFYETDRNITADIVTLRNMIADGSLRKIAAVEKA